MSDDIDLLIDRTRSARFEVPERVRCLNFAQDKIVRDRIDNIKNRKPYSLQSNQMVREQLKALIVRDYSLTPSANVITLPANYMYLDGLKTTCDGTVSECVSMSYDEYPAIDENPFQKPSLDYPRWIEDTGGTGLFIKHNGTNCTNALLSYIKTPPVIAIGTTNILTGTTLVVGDTMYVSVGTVTYNSITYALGSTFIVIAGITVFTGTGTLIIIANCQLSAIIHDEVVELAAAILIGNVENYNKKKVLEIESQRS